MRNQPAINSGFAGSVEPAFFGSTESRRKVVDLSAATDDNRRLSIYKRHHYFSNQLEYAYKRALKDYGEKIADKVLTRMVNGLKVAKTGLFCDSVDGEFIEYAKIKSQNLETGFFEHIRETGGRDSAVEWVKSELIKVGIEFPIKLKDSDSQKEKDEKMVAALARVFCEKWWRRKIRRIANRGVESVARKLGLVSKKKGLYVSDFSFKRRHWQNQRNTVLLERMVATNEDGYSKTLKELSDKGVSNPVNRHAELMVRVRGYEEVAEATGFKGLFFTLTCPSAFHAVHTNGHKNTKFNGSSPAEAQEYLCDQWAKIRASWDRAGVRCFGFRVAEPHHDGTPHWHMLLFFAPDSIEKASEIFTRYALQIDGDEKGAKTHRCAIVEMKHGKSAAGYIAKYIAKNIAGANQFGEGLDDESGEFVAVTVHRVEAWAACWGIRQFQQIGSVSVTVWRELRRLKDKEIEELDQAELEEIRLACVNSDWALFVELMGGPLVERGAQKVRANQIKTAEQNSYGEFMQRITGVIMRGASKAIITRLHVWTIGQVETECISGAGTGAASRANFQPYGFGLAP